MSNKINLQYIISFFGIIPYIFVLLDKYLFFQIEKEIILNFILHYTLIICVFIGSINWNLQKRIHNYLVIYGFLPSLYAVIIIILNLYNFSINNLLLLINIFMTAQLLLDYLLIYNHSTNRNVFYFLRLPLTFIIILTLMII